MILPDFILVNSLNLGLTAVRNDYTANVAAGTPERSVLELLFDPAQHLGNYDAFTQLKALLITTKENPKHLLVRSAFDKTFNGSPFLYVTLAAENAQNNSVNQGLADNDPVTFVNQDGTTSSKAYFQRRFATTYQLVIGSENKNEVVLLYTFLQALLMVLTNHVTFSGLSNIKFGGQDVRINLTVPDEVIMRAITISFEYEQQVPALSFTTLARKILLYWQAQGASVPSGPIVISGDSDDQSI